MTIRGTTLAAEEIRKVYEAGGPIHGLHSRADIGVLLSRRLQKRRQLSDEDAGHFTRFCESAGVEPSILRAEDDG